MNLAIGCPSAYSRITLFSEGKGVIIMKKVCNHCGSTLEISCFNKRENGYRGECKKCSKEYVRNSVLKNIDYYRAYKRVYRKRNRENITEEHRKWLSNNPTKKYAHYRIMHELRMGRMKKLPCKLCGDINSHGHHPDYSKPLEVVWLCPKHHADLHNGKLVLN
jgi:hypothetical protein